MIRNRIDKSAFGYKIIFTEYKGHATDLSRQAVKEGVHVVIAAGGDGSVNEVAKALIHTDTALGILPVGSGNGLARSLGIPLAPSKAMAVINNGQLRAIDVGLAGSHLFLSNAGVGFDALVAKKFEQSRRRGLWSYIFTIMRTFSFYKPALYELSLDGKKQMTEAFFIGIANGNQLGYNFKIAPEATPYDGLLDVCLIGAIPVWKLPLVAIRAYNGRLPKSALVEYIHCKEIVIRMEEPISWMQTDGDAVAVDKNEITVSIVPQALKVIVP